MCTGVHPVLDPGADVSYLARRNRAEQSDTRSARDLTMVDVSILLHRSNTSALLRAKALKTNVLCNVCNVVTN